MRNDCREVAAWLNEFLRIDEIEDYPGALNGLQVDGRRPVTRIGAATDACQATIDLAIDDECDLLLVHHGLFWGGSQPLVGPTYQRFRRLIESGLGLYSAHLPLDTHEDVGNNVLLAKALGMNHLGRFGSAQGVDGLGVIGAVDLSREDLVARTAEACGSRPMVIPGGPSRLQRLAIVTGGAGSMIADAARAGADTFITGEGNHHTFHEAMELGINVLYAGHYATETLGVRALAERAAQRFHAEHVFFDVPTGL